MIKNPRIHFKSSNHMSKPSRNEGSSLRALPLPKWDTLLALGESTVCPLPMVPTQVWSSSIASWVEMGNRHHARSRSGRGSSWHHLPPVPDSQQAQTETVVCMCMLSKSLPFPPAPCSPPQIPSLSTVSPQRMLSGEMLACGRIPLTPRG